MNLALDPQAVSGAYSTGTEKSGSGDSGGLKQTCRDFESVLINSIFQNMRKTVPDGGYLESDMSMDFYQEMLYTEAAGHMAREGGLGLGELLFDQFQGNENKT